MLPSLAGPPSSSSSRSIDVRAPDLAPPTSRLASAMRRASAHLLARLGSDGRLRAGCEGRPLETALTLHLLRVLDREPAVQARLLAFCEAHLATLAQRPQTPASARDLDATVAELAACAATNAAVRPAARAALDAALRAFAHPTQRRKVLVLTTVLAELGLCAPLSAAPARDDVHAPAHHLWTRLMLTAVRILVAARTSAAIDTTEDLAFLLAGQSRDGSWEQHLLVTVVAVLALHAADAAPEARARGLEALLANVRADGGVPFITDEDTWTTCLAAFVLTEAGAPRAALAASAAYLASRQNADGGWAYADGVKQSDADDAALTMLFLRAHDPVAHAAALARGARYFAALRGPDGGVPTFVAAAEGDVEITAKSLRGLHACGRLDAATARRGVAWLAARQGDDGTFRSEWKLCPTYPIFHVLAALDAIGAAGADARRVRDRAVRWLHAQQRSDGGWGMLPGDTESHVTSTAYAVAALAHAGAATCAEADALSRGVAFLLAAQRADGSFAASGDSLGPRPLVYDVPILPTIYGTWALASACRALAVARPGARPLETSAVAHA